MRKTAMTLALPATIIPRAVCARPRADASDPKAMIAQIQAAFDEFKATNEAQLAGKVDVLLEEKMTVLNKTLDDLQAAIDDHSNKLAAAKLGGAPGIAPDAEYTSRFKAYMLDGSNESALKAAGKEGPRAAMSEGSSADGGLLAPVEWDRTITERLKLISPMRQHAQVQSISKAGFTRLFTDRSIGSGWVGETASRPATSTPQFTALSFTPGEIYANAAASQDLLDDAEVDLEQWLPTEIDTEFSRQEGIAFLSGDGSNKPYGLLTYVTGGAQAARHPWGAILSTGSGGSGLITSDALVTLVYALPAAYQPNAKFFMNRLSLASIRKLKDGQGNYIWQPSFQAGQPSTLSGAPLVDMPDMPTVSSGNIPLLYGDMQATYLIIDRIGFRLLRDPYTNKPYICFYCTKRVGGGVQNPDAMKAMTIA